MISSVCWVPFGAAKTTPERYELSTADVAGFKAAAAASKDAAMSEETAAAKAAAAVNANGSNVDRHGLPPELRMDDYGEEHDNVLWDSGVGAEDEAEAEKMMRTALAKSKDSDNESDEDAAMEDGEQKGAGKGKNDSEDDGNGEEITDDEVELDDDDLGSDVDDLEIRDGDRMIVIAQTDEEYSNLEVYVYDTEEGGLYVHHDVVLSAFPLCTAWMGCGRTVLGERTTTDSKNYIGVGTFNPEIEIWNLDVLDAIEPTLTLGGENVTGSHGGAVMGLDWNAQHHHLLASASGDNTVKLWDLAKAVCVKTFSHHSDKVQSVAWNPTESSVLLTGSFDRSIAVVDANAGTDANVVRITLDSDVECCAWNIHRPEQVVASTEDGKVSCFDVRNIAAGPLYSFQAHARKPCSSFSFAPKARGLMATCSPDKTVKLWDTECTVGGQPKCVGEKNMVEAGALFDIAFDPDEPFRLIAGGDKGQLALWDASEDEANLKRVFADRVVDGTMSPQMLRYRC